jgi:hypothetical protein
MVENPIIFERPIVVSGNKAALGRPPEAVLSVLSRRPHSRRVSAVYSTAP